jgi:ribosomal-protein-alanine N-acetyltransferase
MRLEDIPQVLEIERESFPTMWPPTAYKRELEQNRLAHYLVVVQRNPESVAGAEAHDVGTTAPSAGSSASFGTSWRAGGARASPPEERAELVTGVAGWWMLADEAHIVTIAVRESHRRQGIAELLLIQPSSTRRPWARRS